CPADQPGQRPAEVSAGDLALMRRLDELHLEHPHAGSIAGREHRLLRVGTSSFPYLLRGLTIDRANPVWASDITYIPMARGFVYLAGVMEWFARRILAWRLSITLGVDFCIDAVEEALRLHGRPEIFNSDQGSQFTSDAFTDVLITSGIAISMDGKGIVARQRVCRTVLAHFEVTGGLSQGL